MDTKITFLLAVLLSFSALPLRARLSFDFYETSCPAAEFIVSNTVRSASSSDQTIPGKLLRLLFHDCFVEGCDASVLLQGNGTERSDPANTSLGVFSVIDSAKRELEIFCPGAVSCANIVALAARDAVVLVKISNLLPPYLHAISSPRDLNIRIMEQAGGPAIPILTGRRDRRISNTANVKPSIADTSFTMNEMIMFFKSKGLSLDDLVTLSDGDVVVVKRLSITVTTSESTQTATATVRAGGNSRVSKPNCFLVTWLLIGVVVIGM
ncbi:Peroxidase 46 [Hibiscus syriacus]|uniref:peroxidase n=1 Tax=Hibiscus syriacus TaxID=106335 RepID=A0A6A2XFN1_HIBSY|nr:Peroxidase 46 [Hibiscus syriacus]